MNRRPKNTSNLNPISIENPTVIHTKKTYLFLNQKPSKPGVQLPLRLNVQGWFTWKVFERCLRRKEETTTPLGTKIISKTKIHYSQTVPKMHLRGTVRAAILTVESSPTSRGCSAETAISLIYAVAFLIISDLPPREYASLKKPPSPRSASGTVIETWNWRGSVWRWKLGKGRH